LDTEKYDQTSLIILADDLLLGGEVEDYDYLNKSRREVDGVDDREEWFALKVGSRSQAFSATLT
jgi:myosin protein heavy chain